MKTETVLLALAAVGLIVYAMRPRASVTIGEPLIEFGDAEIIPDDEPATPFKILGPKAPTLAP